VSGPQAGPQFGPPLGPQFGPFAGPPQNRGAQNRGAQNRAYYRGQYGPYRGSMYHGGRYRRPVVWRVARRMPLPMVLLVGVVGVVGVMLILSVIAAAFGMAMLVGAIVAPVLIARSVRRSVQHGRYYRQQVAGPPPRAPALTGPPPRPPVDAWRQAKGRFARLRSEYAAYECDALAVLRLPALADVTVPSTARFVEAFAEAQALDVDSRPEKPHRDRYVAAVELAWRSWHAAREAAERIRTSHLPPQERSTIERVVRLLTIARDSDNDAERLVAYGKARSELAKLERSGHLRIPRPAQAALDNAYRGQLPA
jgi:hypothetical protein